MQYLNSKYIDTKAHLCHIYDKKVCRYNYDTVLKMVCSFIVEELRTYCAISDKIMLQNISHKSIRNNDFQTD